MFLLLYTLYNGQANQIKYKFPWVWLVCEMVRAVEMMDTMIVLVVVRTSN